MPSSPPPTEPAGRLLVADRRGAGQPVVLLHGQPGEAADWTLVVDALGDRVRSLAPDRLGYGRTGGAAGTIAANADAVLRLLDEEDIERAIVVGYSWAGGVALDLARRHPERLAAIVLVSSIGAPGSIGDLDRALSAPVVGPALAITGLLAMRTPIVRWVAGPVAPRLPRVPLGSWRAFIVEQRAMTAELDGISAELGTIRVPAVLIVGEADVLVRPEVQARLAAALPDAEVVRVPGAGHLLPWEAPEVIASAVLRLRDRPEPVA